MDTLFETVVGLLNQVWQVLWREPSLLFAHWAYSHPAYYLLLPEWSLFFAIFIIIILDLFLPKVKTHWLIWIAVISLWLNFAMTLHLMLYTSRYFSYGLGLFWGGIETVDPFAIFFKQITDWADTALLAVLYTYRNVDPKVKNETIILFLVATTAFDLMVGSSDLLAIFVMTEFTSISLYLLVALNKKILRSLEAGLKYFLIGAVSAALFLYGISLIYGMVNSTNLYDIKNFLLQPGVNKGHPIFLLAIVLILAGIGFKVAVAPFHMWVPDTYEGATMPVAAFISIFPKVAGFAVVLRIFMVGLLPLKEIWMPIMAILAMVTMTVGNVMAISQTSFKRLMAYSGIAQMGFVVAAIVAAAMEPLDYETYSIGWIATLFYLAMYMFTNLGVFVTGILNETYGGSDHLDSFNGLFQRSPTLAVLGSICLLSLAGIPPTAGFLAKFFVFRSLVAYLSPGNPYYLMLLILIIFAAINTVIGLYYYTMVVKRMIFYSPARPYPTFSFIPKFQERLSILVPTVIIILFGIWVYAPYNYVKGAWFFTTYVLYG